MDKDMQNIKPVISSTPHMKANETIQSIMLDVLIALTPAALMAAYYFGLRAVLVMAASIISAVFFEALYQKATRRRITINDLSAVVTGLLLAFNLPASAPPWLPVVGSFFAIVIAKQLFGGLGQNFINPALSARAFLLAAYPAQMMDWSISPSNSDGISSVTPLAALKASAASGFVPDTQNYIDALIGNTGGCIGETCALALLLGGAYLIFKRVISWYIPITYAVALIAASWLFGRSGSFTGFPVYELLTGGFILGAFFMATDYTTSPVTKKGQFIMGIGCGVITALIRSKGGYPEGVSYSILLMNLAVPIIDRYTKPRVFGHSKNRKKEGAEKNA